jgi:hypothetical protein
VTTDRANDHDRQRSSPVGCLVVVLFLPILYVLSIGPAAWLHDRGYLSNEVGIVYTPLGLLAEHCEPARQTLVWYVRLWGVDLN